VTVNKAALKAQLNAMFLRGELEREWNAETGQWAYRPTEKGRLAADEAAKAEGARLIAFEKEHPNATDDEKWAHLYGPESAIGEDPES
jgi:hypothetical protein